MSGTNWLVSFETLDITDFKSLYQTHTGSVFRDTCPSNSVSDSILKLIVLMISIPGEVISRDFENETIFSCGHENSPQR